MVYNDVAKCIHDIVIPIILVVTAVVIIATLIIVAVIHVYCSDNNEDDEETDDEEVIKKLRNNNNAIAALNPTELEMFLAKEYAKQLELVLVSDMSINDPDSMSKCYLNSSAELIKFLGEDTVDAISDRYGKDFVIKWCEVQFRLLENSGDLAKIYNRVTKSNINITIRNDIN